MRMRGEEFWLVQCPGWLLLLYIVSAQAIPAFDYELGVRMGTQEPASAITEVGVAFWYGFAFGDLVTYIPLLIVGLLGHGFSSRSGRVVLGAALGITVYWPVVSLAALYTARGSPGWQLANEKAYWVVLPVIASWAVIALWRIASAE